MVEIKSTIQYNAFHVRGIEFLATLEPENIVMVRCDVNDFMFDIKFETTEDFDINSDSGRALINELANELAETAISFCEKFSD